MTKAEESKLLEKIADLIEQAGDDSYIGKAFEGCYLIAKENIDNDFWNSWKDRAERNLSEMQSYREKASDLKEAYDVAVENHKNIAEALEKEAARANRLHEDCIKNWNMFREQEEKAAKLEQEIIVLKAKLYDLICK